MEDLLWRKKSTQRYRYLMLFLIRLAETLTVSLLPSVIGLIAVFITPKLRVMQTIEMISLLVFAVANCFFWTRYVFHRGKLREFYIMNSIVYLLYVVISVFAYISSDPYLYSILFSNMRGLELFGFGTLKSLYNAHLLQLLLMFLTGIIAKMICFFRMKKSAGEGVEKAEFEVEDTTPQQDKKNVEFLTVDEVNLELEREMEEARELIRQETARVSDKNWDREMVQGDNGEILEKTPDDPDNDIDDSDYVSEAYAREEMSVTMNYDVDSLWNSEIYQGRERSDEYDEDEYSPEMFISDDEDESLWNLEMYRGRERDSGMIEEDEPEIFDEDDEDEELWDSGMYRGRNRDSKIGEEEYEPEMFVDDDEDDGLWGSDMYRGRDRNSVLEYEEEEDDEPEEQLIDWEEETDEPLFNVEYDDEPEEYFSNNLEDYDAESLWEDFSQGR